MLAAMPNRHKTRYRPRGRRDDMPPSADASSTRGRSTSRQRTGPQSAHLCWPAVAKLAAGSQRAYSLGWDRQTTASAVRRLPSAVRTATPAFHVRSSRLFCSLPGGLKLVTRLPARSVTFLRQFSPRPENFSRFTSVHSALEALRLRAA